MKKIILKKLHLENFKGCKDVTVDFGSKTLVKGQNATGKTTLVDAFTWVLFDKDSTGATKFQVRPLDSDGNPIHFVEIKAEVSLEIDEVPYTLSKKQKEKWVKKRGSEEQEFQGNVNEFEINGYPKSEKDFKSFVTEIVDEKLFRMITNPMAFTSLPWKEQREVLYKLVNDMNDYDIAAKNDEFKLLLPELQVAKLDDIKTKYTKSKNELNKQLVEIPARIDEISKQIVVIDTAELELEKAGLKKDIATINDKIGDTEKLYAEKNAKANEIMELKFEISDYERKANTELVNKKKAMQEVIDKNRYDSVSYNTTLSSKKRYCETVERDNQGYNAQKEKTKLDYINAKKRVFDDSSLVCSYCGQEYPQEKKEALKAEFETHKAKELEAIGERGKELSQKVKDTTEEIISLKAEIDDIQKRKEIAEKAMEEYTKQLKALPESVDLSGDKEYKKLLKKLSDMESAMNDTSDIKDLISQLKAEAEEKRNALMNIELQISKADCSSAEERKAELEEEQVRIGQRVADCEKMLYLVDKFTKEKLDRISEMVNSKFEMVNFNLFTRQINGGIAECCECTVNGVPFNVLNNGHKIAAGIDIIRTLSVIFNVSAPIFTDNAEAINEFNIPKTDSQLILLMVTEDKTMKVEV